MHEMRPIAVDDPAVCQSVCHAALVCKTVEGIEVQFEVKILGGGTLC